MRQKTRILIYILIAIAAVIMGTLAILQNHQAADKPITAQEHIDLGRIYLTDLSYEKAVLEFTEAIEIEPLNPDAYLGLAEAYVGMGDTEKAIEILEEGYDKTGDEQLRDMLEKLAPSDVEETTSITTVTEIIITTEETTTVSTEERVIVPNLSGLTEEEAIAACELAGLQYSVSYDYSDEVENGYVIKQTIPVDASVAEGISVPFTVSKGAKTVTTAVTTTTTNSFTTEETTVSNIEYSVKNSEIIENSSDYIKIISVVADGKVIENTNCAFLVTIEYNLSSCEKGIVYVGFNNDEYDVWHLTKDNAIVSKGTNTITITTEANVVYWDDELMHCYVNLSKYPHESSWSPLVSDTININIAESVINTSQYYAEDFLGMTYKEVFQILGEGKMSAWNGGWGYYWEDLGLELTAYQNEVILNYPEKTIIPEESHVGLVYTWSKDIPANRDLTVGMPIIDVVNKYKLNESDIYTIDINSGYNLFIENKYNYSVYVHTSGESDYNEPITEIALQAKDYYEKS